MKNIMVRKDVTTLIRRARAVARGDGKEICGLLIHNGHFIEIIETKNRSNRGGSFVFDAREIKNIERATGKLNHEIIGTFHSHPAATANPGDGDISSAVDDSLMLIIDCMGNDATLWKIKNKRARRIKYKSIEV